MKASTAPAGAKLIENLLAKGWIERRGTGNELSYRITDKGLAASDQKVSIDRDKGWFTEPWCGVRTGCVATR
jgi:DNA-binding transcriptional regulator PaaX